MESDIALHTLAGPEIGVASTKAFTTQITTLACLALAAARKRKKIDPAQELELSEALRHIPAQVANLLTNTEAHVESIAREIFESRDMLYIGRGLLYPIALEGALKLKEVSYIHAEGYAAGELKHGPIALIDENMPLVVLAPGNDPLFEKTASNLQENAARGAKILLITDKAGHERLSAHVKYSIVLEDIHPFTAPLLYVIPVQLLAYYVAVAKGTDVDMPRNLAKAVTVE